jgi:hypothetical protein
MTLRLVALALLVALVGACEQQRSGSGAVSGPYIGGGAGVNRLGH